VDEQTRLFLWVLACAGGFAVLGGLFGAVTGYVAWKEGRAAGTALGLSVGRAFARAAGGKLPPQREGALVGAADGVVFLGGLGTVIGLVLCLRGQAGWEAISPALFAGMALVGAAVLFGGLACLLLFTGFRGLVWLIAGAALGFTLAYARMRQLGLDRTDAGTTVVFASLLAGAAGGLALAAMLRWWRRPG